MNMELYREINNIPTETLRMCDAEKERVLEHVLKSRKPKRRFALKTVGALAACCALLVVVSAFSPALAESLPFMENILGFLRQTKAARYQSPVVNSGAVERYLAKVGAETGANFEIIDAYCDGTALVLSAAIRVENAAPEINVLEPEYTLSLNGAPLLVKNAYTGETHGTGGYFARLIRTDDHNFIGTIVVDVSDFNLTGDFTLTVAVDGVTGIDDAYLVQTDRGVYEAKTHALEESFEPRTVTVCADRSLETVYEVGDAQNGITLHSLVTTPAYTRLDVSGDYYYYDVRDQDGNAIPWLKFGTETGRTYYEPLPAGTTALAVRFYAKNDRLNPLAAFTVPVDGGYVRAVYEPVTAVRTDVVYDPPLQKQSVVRWGESTVPFGETITSTAYAQDGCEGSVAVTFSNLQVFDSAADFGLTEADMADTEAPLQPDGMRFVTLDVQFVTRDFRSDFNAETISEDDAVFKELAGYDANDGTASMYWISSYAAPFAENAVLDSAPAYFSGHMNGVTNYGHFAMNENDARSFTVGYFIPDEVLASGGLLIGVRDGGTVLDGFSASPRNTYCEIPAID